MFHCKLRMQIDGMFEIELFARISLYVQIHVSWEGFVNKFTTP